MNKKIVLAVIAVVTALAMTGCTFTSTTTRTETHTDANGKTTTTTSTVTNQNGKITESSSTVVEEPTQDNAHVATVAVANQTGLTISGLYFVSEKEDSWGDELMGEYAPLEADETITFHNRFRYTDDDASWALAIVIDGNSVEFRELNLTKAANAEDIKLVLTYDAETSVCTVTIQ